MNNSIQMAVQADNSEAAAEATRLLLANQPRPHLLVNYSINPAKTIKFTPTVRQRSTVKQTNKAQVLALCQEALKNVLHRTDLAQAHAHILPLVVRFLLFHYELPVSDTQLYNLQAFSHTLPEPAELKAVRWWLVTVEYDYAPELEKCLPELISNLENHLPAFAGEGVLVGGKAVQECGSSRHPNFSEYLINSPVFPAGLSNPNPRNWVYNAWGDPFLTAIWNNVPKESMGGTGTGATVMGTLIYAYLAAIKANNMIWADEVELDLKFYARYLRKQPGASPELIPEEVKPFLKGSDQQLIIELFANIRGLQ